MAPARSRAALTCRFAGGGPERAGAAPSIKSSIYRIHGTNEPSSIGKSKLAQVARTSRCVELTPISSWALWSW
jgi:hypothetical protein